MGFSAQGRLIAIKSRREPEANILILTYSKKPRRAFNMAPRRRIVNNPMEGRNDGDNVVNALGSSQAENTPVSGIG